MRKPATGSCSPPTWRRTLDFGDLLRRIFGIRVLPCKRLRSTPSHGRKARKGPSVTSSRAGRGAHRAAPGRAGQRVAHGSWRRPLHEAVRRVESPAGRRGLCPLEPRPRRQEAREVGPGRRVRNLRSLEGSRWSTSRGMRESSRRQQTSPWGSWNALGRPCSASSARAQTKSGSRLEVHELILRPPAKCETRRVQLGFTR